MFTKTGQPAKIITTDLCVIKDLMCQKCKLNKQQCCADCGVNNLNSVTVQNPNDLVDDSRTSESEWKKL